MLGVAEVQIVAAVGGQLAGEQGIGVVGVQPRTLVGKVVVEGQLFAGSIGQAEDGVERRIEPACEDLGDDLLAGSALETEDIPVARLVDKPVHDDRQRDALSGG